MTKNLEKPCINKNSHIRRYLDWLHREAVASGEKQNGWDVLILPYLDYFNDFLELYVKEIDGAASISDDGYFIQMLDANGWNKSPYRERMEAMLARHHLNVYLCEVCVRADETKFPEVVHDFVQAYLEFSGMMQIWNEEEEKS